MGTLLEIGLNNAMAAAVLAPLVAIVARLLRSRRPAWAHGLWLLVLLKLITPPLFTVPVSWPIGPETEAVGNEAGPSSGEILSEEAIPAPLAIATATEHPDELTPLSDSIEIAPPVVDRVGQPPSAVTVTDSRGRLSDVPWVGERWSLLRSWSWRDAIGLAWLASSAAWLGLAAWRIRRFRNVLKLAGPAPVEVRERVEALAKLIGLRRPPVVALVAGTVSPLIWALSGRAWLVVPRGLWERLDDDQREAMLLHELAHLRRRDHWVRVVELVATGLYWWHPALWWLRRGLHEAEEQCCDAWVVWARPELARTYATALVEAVDFLSTARPAHPPVGACGLGRLGSITRRITMIMKGKTPRALSWLGVFTLVALGLLLLPWLPTWGQAPATDKAGFNPEAARALIDEIEILENQVVLKQALVRKAEAGRELAESSFNRLKSLQDRGVASSGELAKAKAEHKIADADVGVAKAELREVELKLAQARRQLAGMAAVEAPRPEAAHNEPTSPYIVHDENLRLQQARVKERLASSTDPRDRETVNHLKMIGLALWNYYEQHGSFPPPAIRAPDGTPLLSWRVAILPFLEGEDSALYQQFHLDEPWDSPHNRTLISSMPEAFQTFRLLGQTSLLAPVGPGTLWDDPNGVSFAKILDGASNTIAVVNANRAVPWTKPEDLIYPASGSFATLYESGFWALLADGSVRHFQPANPMILHALLSRAGGEVIDTSQIDITEEVPHTRPPYQGPPSSTAPQGGAAMEGMAGAGMMSGMMSNMMSGGVGAGMGMGSGMPMEGMMPGMMNMEGMPGMGAAMMPGVAKKGAPSKSPGTKKGTSEKSKSLGSGRAMEGMMSGVGMMPGMGMPGMGMMPGMPGALGPDQIVAELKARIEQLRKENQDLREQLSKANKSGTPPLDVRPLEPQLDVRPLEPQLDARPLEPQLDARPLDKKDIQGKAETPEVAPPLDLRPIEEKPSEEKQDVRGTSSN